MAVDFARAPWVRYTIVMWVMTLVPVAHALDEAELRSIVEQIRPRVEAVAGRRFDTMPASAIDDWPHIREEILKRHADDRPNSPAARRRAEELDAEHAKTIAVYLPDRDTLFLISDRLRNTLKELDAAPEDVRPLVQCIVAHELTHALTFRHAAGPSLSQDRAGASMLREGFATWVAGEVCPERGRNLDDATSGRDRIASLDRNDPFAFSYHLGAVFADVYIRRYGLEAWWWRLDQDPPEASAVHAIADASLLRDWRDATRLAEPIHQQWGFHDGRYEAGGTSLFVELRDLTPGVPTVAVHTTAGMAYQIEEEARAANASVWRVADEAEANAAVMARATHLNHETRPMFSSMGLAISTSTGFGRQSIPASTLPDGAAATLWARTRMTSGKNYHELWVARGPTVWRLLFYGDTTRRDLLAALGNLVRIPLDTEPVGVENSPAALAALEALAPPAVLPMAQPSGIWVGQALELRDPKACIDSVEAGLHDVAAAGVSAMLESGINCALRIADVHAIARFGEVADGPVRAYAVSALYDLNAYTLAHRVASGPGLDDLAYAELRRTVALLAAAEAGDWPTVRAGLIDERIPSRARGQAAVMMWNAGKGGAARAALHTMCGVDAPAKAPDWCADVRMR